MILLGFDGLIELELLNDDAEVAVDLKTAELKGVKRTVAMVFTQQYSKRETERMEKQRT